MSKDLTQQATEVAALLKALAHPQRLLMLCALADGAATVGELQERLGLEQAYASQQLARLRLEGLVEGAKEGQQVRYGLADERVGALLKAMAKIYCKELA